MAQNCAPLAANVSPGNALKKTAYAIRVLFVFSMIYVRCLTERPKLSESNVKQNISLY